jgi:8-oxo-dGTP diphosphatase
VTVPLYLIRHADAGSRKSWDGPDDQRPLSPKGWHQAQVLVERFEGLSVVRLTSSPFVRCVQTLEPLAGARHQIVDTDQDLAEGTPAERVEALLVRLADRVTAACSHGDVIEAVIPHLVLSGMRVEGEAGFAKGSVWELQADDGRFVSARYWPAP